MKKLIALLMAAALIFTLGCAQQQSSQGGIAQAPSDSMGGGTSPSAPAVSNSSVQGGCMMDGMPCSQISASELAAHNSASDCWVAFQGKVYDITSFVPNHPGGPGRLIPLCGTSSQFEAAFTVKHGMSKVAVLESVGVYKGTFSA
ncbi:MAG: cytochrome b5-like heme/steroid binding domain-containing protein [Candidatus Micrarchaeia archaeon]